MEINLKEKFMVLMEKLENQKNPVYTKDQFFELKKYNLLLFDCFLWNYRYSYLKLFVSFLNYDISGEEFSEKLITMRANHINEFHELMKQLQLMILLNMEFKFLDKFDVNRNAFGFTDIIDLVEQDCDSFVSDKLLLELGGSRENGEIDETQLRESIEKVLPLIMVDK